MDHKLALIAIRVQLYTAAQKLSADDELDQLDELLGEVREIIRIRKERKKADNVPM